MIVKEFVAFSIAPEQAVTLLTQRMNTFLKPERTLEEVSISHSVIEILSNVETERFMASALVIFR